MLCVLPTKHETLIQWWASVEDVVSTVTQHKVNVATTTILVNLKKIVKTVLQWALNNAGACYFMQYIYFYIIMKYVALILLNYDYIIYCSHLPRHLSTGSSSDSACMRIYINVNY